MQDITGRTHMCPLIFELFYKIFCLIFHFRLLGQKIITTFVFGTDIIQILAWFAQNQFQKSGI